MDDKRMTLDEAADFVTNFADGDIGTPLHDVSALLEGTKSDLATARTEIESFDFRCNERQHTDTGDVWTLLWCLHKLMGGSGKRETLDQVVQRYEASQGWNTDTINTLLIRFIEADGEGRVECSGDQETRLDWWLKAYAEDDFKNDPPDGRA